MVWGVSTDTVLSGGLGRHRPLVESCCFHDEGEGKGKGHPIAGHEGPEVE